MRGVIYARYSSDNQREESIEGQIRENTAYAEKNGITIVGQPIVVMTSEEVADVARLGSDINSLAPPNVYWTNTYFFSGGFAVKVSL